MPVIASRGIGRHAIAVMLLGLVPHGLAALGTEVVRGRVIDMQKKPVAAAAQVRATFTRLLGGNPIARILALRDSLALTPDQLSSIDAVNREFIARLDSVQAPVVAALVARGKRLTNDEYIQQQMAVGLPSRRIYDAERQKAIAFLLPDQRDRLAALTHQH